MLFQKIKTCLIAATSLLLCACGGSGSASNSASVPVLSPAAQLGQKIFHDGSLSSTPTPMSCATCHDPAIGHAGNFNTPVAVGGINGTTQGLRNPPAIRYLKYNSAFSFAADGTPTGGFFWDGRANSLAEQAKGPFLNPAEMANPDVVTVIAKLRNTAYAQQFKQVFGTNILDAGNEATAYERVAYALERYQVEDSDFAPFSSKFDAVMQGQESFTPMEARGYVLFNSPTKGNCFACHPSTKPANAPAALFTDFTYDNLGLPRNGSIDANNDANFYDMGLCGALNVQTNTYKVSHAGLESRADLCGLFKVPSLRNVGTRKHFFHNGKFTTLEQVVEFYVTRDTNPFGNTVNNTGQAAWYPAGDKFNDLPNLFLATSVKNNVNTTEVPYNQTLGGTPTLNALEQQDLVAFLKTLTDR